MVVGRGELEVRASQRLARGYVPKASKMREPLAQRDNVRWVIESAERPDRGRRRGTDRQNAEAGAMQKFEMRIVFGQFGEQAMDSEVIAQHVRVVKQHDGAIRQFWPPAVKVVSHGLVGVKAVDVEEIDRAIGEM